MPDVTFPSDVTPQFTVFFDAFMRAREHRRGGAPFSLVDIKANADQFIATAGQPSRTRRFLSQIAAEQAAVCGYLDGALELVQQAVDAGLFDLAWMNRLPLLDPLRGDERFEALRRTVAARAAHVTDAWHGAPDTFAQALASL
jgi:hypothetical protein